jgi:hypothetical protein
MNPEAYEVLAAICLKEVHELNSEDIGFLRARREYLTNEQFDKYASVIYTRTEPSTEHVQPEEEKKEEASAPQAPVTETVQENPLAELDGMYYEQMNLEQLKKVALVMGIKGVHFYKDENKLRAVIIEKEQSQEAN